MCKRISKLFIWHREKNMQLITASEAQRLSAHAQSWIAGHMMWFMNHVMDAIAHEASAGGNSVRFEYIRIGTHVDIEAWKSEMKDLGYTVSSLAKEAQGSDSFTVSW
jgi:hypothetical protein